MNERSNEVRVHGWKAGGVRFGALLLTVLMLAACGGEKVDATRTNATQSNAAPAQHATVHDEQVQAEAAEHAGHEAADHEAADHAAHDTTTAGAHANHAEALAAAPLPGTSIFHLSSAFTDHHGAELQLGELRGRPSVFVMFYGDCTTACPLLVRSAEEIEAALPEPLREETQFVMVSFDTERDTPDKLRAYAQEKGLDKGNWHWLVGSPLQTRQLATLLGVQFRDAGNGVFAHSNLVTVLDPDGVPSARLEGLGVKLEPAVAAIRSAGANTN